MVSDRKLVEGYLKLKIAIIITAGIGDGVMLLPLIDRLLEQGNQITLFFEGYGLQKKYFNISHFKSLKSVNSYFEFGIQGLMNFKRYDRVLLNHLCGGRRHKLFARLIGKRVYKANPTKGVRRHDVLTNLNISNNSEFITGLNDLDYVKKYFVQSKTVNRSGVVIQVFAGSGINTYKNWPAKNWHSLIARLSKHFPSKNFYLLGSKEESTWFDNFQPLGENVINLMGQTNLEQAISIVNDSEAFVGVDGGLYHLAALSKKPTYTIWGPSDPSLYCYDQFNSVRHAKKYLAMSCSPCNAWFEPNTSRVLRPEDCPDRKCLTSILVDDVYDDCLQFLSGHLCVE